MNRRDFLRYLCGTSAAAVLVPSGLLLPDKVARLPERWERHGAPALSLIDDQGRIAASQLLRRVNVIESNRGSELHADTVTFEADMFDAPEDGIVITGAIVSIPMGGGAYFDKSIPKFPALTTNGGDLHVVPHEYGWLQLT